MGLQAYRGDAGFKATFVAELKKHREADAIIQGSYGKSAHNTVGFRGCAVGCGAHSLGLSDFDNHETYADLLGWPTTLAYLQDAIHEGLPFAEAVEWPAQLAETITEGDDLTPKVARFFVWLMVNPDHGVRQFANEQSGVAIDAVAGLWQRVANGENVPPEEFRSASAAWSAAVAAAEAKDNFWRAARDEMLRLLKAVEKV